MSASARSVSDIAAEVARLMPTHLSGPATPLLGGFAAGEHSAEVFGAAAANSTTIGGAADVWLDLVGRGLGMPRADGEDDDTYRQRLRSPQYGVTKANLAAAVNAILSAYGLPDCRILEWMDGPYLSRTMYLSHCLVVARPNFFVVVVDSPSTYRTTAFLSRSVYLSRTAYLGEWETGAYAAAYAAIVALVNALRAAGVRWALYLKPSTVYLP